jgi:hypothetical protein
MNRRDLITSAGTVGFLCGLGGCSTLRDSSGSTKTQTRTKIKTGHPLETETDQIANTTTPTPSADVQVAIEEIRSELATAFEIIHSLEFYQENRLVTNPNKFDQYDPEAALSHVEKARELLTIVDQHSKDQQLKNRYAVLAGLALLAEEGAKLYDNFRKTFLSTWEYIYAFEHAFYEDAVQQIGKARTLLAELPAHHKEVSDALISVGNAPVSSKVENFNLEKWVNIEANIRERTPSLKMTLEGFEAYAEAVIYDGQGLEALDDEDPNTAYESFQKAIKTVNKSKESLEIAKQREAIFFKSRLDAYYCRGSGMKKAYTFHLQAAGASAEGNEQKATNLREKGTNKIGETVDNCQIN